jgi:ribosomal protein RSM22 (predicted rRNA methylase)
VKRYLVIVFFLGFLFNLGFSANAEDSETSVKGLLAYRSSGSLLKSREDTALVVKTNVPLETLLRIIRVDNDLLFKISGLNDFSNLEKTVFYELSPGRHVIVLTIARRVGVSNSFLVTKQINVNVNVEAGKEYVLWGDVWEGGSKVGLSRIDDFCTDDYCKSQIKDQSRLENARKKIKSQARGYWKSRDIIETVTHY